MQNRVAFAHKHCHKILGIFKPCDVIYIMNDMAIPVMEFQKREYEIKFLSLNAREQQPVCCYCLALEHPHSNAMPP